jgi:uncharacterized protein (TIGR03435 family)
MGEFVEALGRTLRKELDYPLIDRTGVTGKFNITFDWTPNDKTVEAATATTANSG